MVQARVRALWGDFELIFGLLGACTASRAKRGEPLRERASAARSRTHHPEGGTPFDNIVHSEPREARRASKRAGERSEVANESPGGGYFI